MRRACSLTVLVSMSAIACEAPGATTVERVGLTVDHVVNQAGQYAGTHVTVSGELVDVWTSRVFTIADAPALGNTRKLLVVSRSPVPAIGAGGTDASLPPNTTLRVTGVLRLDDIGEIERDTGLSLSVAVKQLWRPQLPIVVADEVLISPQKVP